MTAEERKRLSAALRQIAKIDGAESYLLMVVEGLARQAALAAKSVEWTHGGKRAKFLVPSEVPEPDEAMPALGPLIEVVYLANKGDRGGRALYQHEFEGPHPWLVYNKKGKLLIAGGGYTVNDRGIVGL